MDFNFEESNNIKNDKNVDNLVKSCDNLILKKKKLIDISKNLTKIEYLEIFNIIQEDKCIYSENKNGIFINLLNVSESTIDKIFDFINFIKHKKEDLLKYEEYVSIAKKNISDVQKSTINNNITSEKEYSDNNYEISDSDDDDDKINEYLVFSSDEEDDLENKLSLKKKKIKYSGKKAKMIKSIKDGGNNNSNNKNKNKKSEE